MKNTKDDWALFLAKFLYYFFNASQTTISDMLVNGYMTSLIRSIEKDFFKKVVEMLTNPFLC